MIEQISDARQTSEHTVARGPFRLDEFNLYRFWFSVRNVFFPMRTELAQWKIELVDTSSWQICCDRQAKCVEVADRVFADRNDLRATLVLATIVSRSGRDSMDLWLDDIARVAEMAAFIRHSELAARIRAMHQAMLERQIEIAFNNQTGLVHCRVGGLSVDSPQQDLHSPDPLFDDTLASGSFSKLLAKEIAKHPAGIIKRKTVA